MNRRAFLGLALAALAAASLACDLAVGGPQPPASPIAFSTEAAGGLADMWKNITDNAQAGQFSLIITEPQITSFVAVKLAAQENPPLKDVQVFLRDGKIQLYGTAQAGNLSTTALVVIAVTVQADGSLAFTVESADFGPLPVPAALLDSLSGALSEALTGSVGTTATGFRITNLIIADGQMAITGEFTR